MTTKSTFSRVALGCAAAATVLAGFAPSIASAQSYGSGYSSYDQGGYSYDACRRSQTNRQTVGAIAGAALGIAAGNNLSDRRSHRHEGSAIGGVLGAVVGSQIGKNSAACTPGAETAYSSSTYVAPAPAYESYGRRDYYDTYQDRRDRYADSNAYARDYVAPSRADTNNRCTYAESPIYMPDGTVQTRMVQVCPDRNGRYQVVQ